MFIDKVQSSSAHACSNDVIDTAWVSRLELLH